MIKVTELTKSFGLKQVLKNINLTFSEGKVYGIVGENGAGKTTLFRCISGLEDYQGEVFTISSSGFQDITSITLSYLQIRL